MLPKLTTAIIADLNAIHANCVTNSDTISDGQNSYQGIRGFVGIPKAPGNDLFVGFNWGQSATLQSVVLKISPVNPTSVAVSFMEQPTGMSSSQINNLVESFMTLMVSKVATKKKKVLANKKSTGGCYTGKRLEAHNRSKKAPKDSFAIALNVLFTKTFVTYAKQMTVTYK